MPIICWALQTRSIGKNANFHLSHASGYQFLDSCGGQVFVNWPPSPPSPACSLSLTHTQRDREATSVRARPGKSVHSKSLSLFHHITLHSSSSDGKLKSRCQCAPSTSFLWLMTDDSSTMEAEELAV